MINSLNIQKITHPYYGSICGFSADKILFEHVKKGLIWEPHLVEQFERYIKPGSIAVDCGANIGLHTLAMAISQPQVKEIIAFEPNLEIFSVLHENTSDRPKIKACNTGVSDKHGEMIATTIAGSTNPAGAVLFDGSLDNPLNSGQYKVEVVTLDSMALQNVSFIKIDVEGHEMRVIEGAKQLLATERPVLIVEIWDLEEPELRGSKIETICAFGYEAVPISRIDTLFVPLSR